MRCTMTIVLAILGSTAVGEGRLMCMGASPSFMAIIEGGEGSFDYLGDGRYDFAPVLTERPEGFQQLTMTTAREQWDVFLTEQTCQLLTFQTNISIEFAVPTSAGDRPMTGCCIWRDSVQE